MGFIESNDDMLILVVNDDIVTESVSLERNTLHSVAQDAFIRLRMEQEQRKSLKQTRCYRRSSIEKSVEP